MELELDLQDVSASGLVPAREDLARWAHAALAGRRERAELSIRVVDDAEGAELNQRYRGRRGATNVLSFPFEPPPGVPELDLIGDLVICAPVVERESDEQGIPLAAHWAHLVIHGVLHLLGYDHQDPAQATEMEALETHLLGGLGFPPPYEDR
ncbi:MAG: rRNA maturation RNase YbeY [Chromatiaceae bacterium]|jgi:probable rRNA maturation factor|nr:rRNA maturation RNase YbeY [Chromatiaceae bacterium]